MATLEQRRKADRKRFKRWRKKKLAEGNKQLQVMLTPEAQKILKFEKERSGEPYAQIVNRLIISIEDGTPSITAKTKTRPLWEQKMIKRIRKLRSEGHAYTEIAKMFNDEGIKTFKGIEKWHGSSVSYLDGKG